MIDRSMSALPSFIANSLMVFILALIAGCLNPGPNYQPPGTPVISNFSIPDQPVPDGVPGSTNWWMTLNIEALNQLVSQAITHNFDVQIAFEKLAQSRALQSQIASAFRPNIDAGMGLTKIRNSDNFLQSISPNGGQGIIPAEFDQWTIDAPVSWELDFFGGGRRQIEATRARQSSIEESIISLRLLIVAEVVDTYFSITGTLDQIDILNQSIQLQSQSLELTRKRVQAGIDSQIVAEQAASQLQNIRARLPLLEAQRTSQLRRLSLLTGSQPSFYDDVYTQWSRTPEAVAMIDSGLPADLIRRRPDIRQAERLLAASSADIGVALANFYPKFYMLGKPQLLSSSAINLLESSSFAWQFAPRVEWAVFSGGRNQALLDAARSRQKEAMIQYEKIVIQALGEVESSLASLGGIQRQHQLLMSSLHAAEVAMSLSSSRLESGEISLLDHLVVHKELLAVDQVRLSARTALIQTWVRLHLALASSADIALGI